MLTEAAGDSTMGIRNSKRSKNNSEVGSMKEIQGGFPLS